MKTNNHVYKNLIIPSYPREVINKENTDLFNINFSIIWLIISFLCNLNMDVHGCMEVYV